MRDGKARLTRHVDVDLHIWPRIEDRPDAFIIVAQQIRKLRDSFGLNRFKNERHRVTLRRNRSEVQLQFWGERRLPACSRRQLADDNFLAGASALEGLFGRLPK